MQNKCGAYMIDGCTSVTTENTIFATPVEWNLVQAHNVESGTVADVLPKTRDDILTMQSVNAEVVAFCSDNCNTMLKLRNEIASHFPETLVFGCTAHLGDLSLEKLTTFCNTWKNLESQVWEVQKAFRVPKIRRKLKVYNGLSPLMPPTTRFHYLVDMLLNYQANRTAYKYFFATLFYKFSFFSYLKASGCH